MLDSPFTWFLLAMRAIIFVTAYPNDPLYDKQAVFYKVVKIPEAWKVAQGVSNRRPATIAIIDSGMMSDHPDLKANAVPGYNVVDKDTDTHDREGHGTRVAGIAGAVVNNGIGIAGAADLVKLMPIYDGQVKRDGYLATAIHYAVYAKADVILFAGGRTKPYGGVVEEALHKAAEANIPFICSAGNNGANISKPDQAMYPCAYTLTMNVIICVAGTLYDTMRLAPGSNYASFVDIAAPADAVTTTNTGDYAEVQGTSASAAMVAGVVAMMKSVASKTLTVRQVKTLIKVTSTPNVKSADGKTTMRFGMLNAEPAVTLAAR